MSSDTIAGIKKDDIENIYASKRIEKTANNIKDYKLGLDENVEKIKGLANVYGRKEINLNFIERFTRMIYTNPLHLAKLEFLQYIFFIVILYYYNPFNINTKYPAFTSLLLLVVSFTYVILYIFIKMKVEAAEDVDLIGPTEKTILYQFFSTIVFFILFMLGIKGVLWLFMNTSIINIFRHTMSVLIVAGILGIVYLFMKKSINKAKNANGKSFLKLLLKVVMYIPCLLVDIVEYVKYEFHLTTKPVWILAGVEAGFVGLWFILPYLVEKVMSFDGIKLLNEPVNLNKEHVIGDFNSDTNNPISIDQLYSNNINKKTKQDLMEQPEDTLDNAARSSKKRADPNVPKNKYLAWIYNKYKHGTWLKVNFDTHPQYTDYNTNRFSYKYALSSWFYINPQPPNTNSSYSTFTNILNYGKKINIEYNGKLNTLRVMAAVPSSMKDDGIKPNDKSAPSDLYESGNLKHIDATSGKMNSTENKSKYMRDQELFNNKNKSVEIYSTTNVIYQKWNNIVINYDDGHIDVFLNGVLVSSISGAVPFMSFDTLVAGAKDGIVGGICNVNYYRNTLDEKTIKMNYKTLRIKNFPYV